MGKRKGGKKSKSESGARSRSASKSKDPAAVNKTVENKECPPSTEEEIVKKEGKYYYF